MIGNHQPCKGGVCALLAVMAAICVGMWWIAPDVSAPRYMKDDIEFFAACDAAAEQHEPLVVTKNWELDGGTCNVEVISIPSDAILHVLPGKTVTLTGVVIQGGDLGPIYSGPIKEIKMDVEMPVNNLRIDTAGTSPAGLIHVDHEMPFVMHGVSDSEVERFGAQLERTLSQGRRLTPAAGNNK